MTAQTEATTQAARKTHRCSWCDERIEIGETYLRYRYFSDGDAGTVKMHPECYEAMNEEVRAYGGPIEWTPGEVSRPIKEEA